jgi:hypothetical protein
MVIYVFPSEVAALCGRNPFHDKSEAIRIMMDRQLGTRTRKRKFTEIQKAGIQSEQNLVTRGLLHDNNTTVKKTLKLPSGVTLLLHGKVDGLNECGEPVEVKHRTTVGRSTMFEHEKIQLHVYMFILDKQHGTFIETNGHTDDIYVQHVEWDLELWNSISEELQLGLGRLFLSVK